MTRYMICLFMLLIILTTSCQYDPYAHRFIRSPPKESDLVGIWKSQDGTEVIEIKDDHTATGEGKILFERTNSISFENIQGSWDIEKYDIYYILRIHWKSSSRFKGMYAVVMILDSPPHTLLIHRGDPDTGNVLTLTKTESSEE